RPIGAGERGERRACERRDGVAGPRREERAGHRYGEEEGDTYGAGTHARSSRAHAAVSGRPSVVQHGNGATSGDAGGETPPAHRGRGRRRLDVRLDPAHRARLLLHAHMRGTLHGTRILDLTHEPGFFTGKILGELGADVVKVEPPGGDPARRRPPFWG